MRHTTIECSQPHTTAHLAIGLLDSPEAEMHAAAAETAQIHADQMDELAEHDRQLAADAIDMDFVDYIGTGKIHTLIDAFEKHDVQALKSELARLVEERSVYRRQFMPRTVTKTSARHFA